MLKRAIVCQAILLAFIIQIVPFSALAVGPSFWEISKQEDVLKGDARGVSVSENGTIMLAPTSTLVYDTKEAYIWSSTTDQAGNIYIGTGHEGRIFKVDASGNGSLLYDSPELDVTALATDPAGNLYAGTSPDGKIYRITPDGKSSVFSDPPDKYIWSLLYDPATSTLYAGTGNKGIIYRIDQAGKATVLVDTNETNIVTLALDKQGNLLAGTDPSGLVLRVSAAGKTFALLDSPLQEIHKLSVASDGSIYALGINPQQASTTASKGNIGVSSTTSLSSEGVITISTSDTDTQTVSTVSSSDLSSLLNQGSKAAGEGSKSAVFRLGPDGGSEVIWSSRDTAGFSIGVLPDKRLLVGTGTKGRIYSVTPADHSSMLMLQSAEDQASTILQSGDSIYATTSNLGRLYRIGRQTISEGVYTSPVRDTKFNATWGRLNWRGSGNVELQTRTGNTETPDATWSDWSAPYRNQAGEQISSPRARFIQWRATLRSNSKTPETPVALRNDVEGSAKPAAATSLQAVTVAFLSRNQAPDITSVTVLPTGVALQEMPVAVDPSIQSSGLDPQLFGVVATVPPRRYYQKGSRTITWQATDPNDDTLQYTLYYRTAGDSLWHLLSSNQTQNYYTIDASKLPDGSYQFRVVASDSPSNPEGLALTNEMITDVYEIDNTPPDVTAGKPVVTGRAVDITFDCADATSRVVRGEYSLDGGAWQMVYPVDGIADSPRETFSIKTSFTGGGEHVIAFRCSDSSGNVGTSKVTVRVQ